MRAFVAGSSGVLGRASIQQLCARGHQVVGLVRSEEKASVVRELGAEPVVGDMFDLEFLRGALRGADVIIHLATALPRKRRPTPANWVTNDRLWREGTRNLIEAARGEKLHAYIQQSVAFLYGDRRGSWVTEDEPPRPPANLKSAVEGEQMALAAYDEFDLPSVILRGATLYGPEAWSTRNLISAVKRRLAPIIGGGEQYWHYVYVEDMARACVRAAENPAPGEIFFVADDWPFHARDFLTYLAAQLQAPAPIKMTVTLARLLVGELALSYAQSVRYRTDKIKKMLGWTPRYPTYREGFAEILPQMGVRLE
jgi:nucleoside-diphosphate-sugar epimerase